MLALFASDPIRDICIIYNKLMALYAHGVGNLSTCRFVGHYAICQNESTLRNALDKRRRSCDG